MKFASNLKSGCHRERSEETLLYEKTPKTEGLKKGYWQ